MHFKRIIKAFFIFIVVELFLYSLFRWYASGQFLKLFFGRDVLNDQAVQAGMDALKKYCDGWLCFEIAFFISVAYLIFSIHKPAYTAQQEGILLKKKLYDQLDERSQYFVDQLNDEDKERFYREYQEQLWVKFHVDVTQYLSDIRKPRFSGITRMARRIVGCFLAVFIGLQVFHIYSFSVPVIERAKRYRIVATNTGESKKAQESAATLPEIEIQTDMDSIYAKDISEIKEAIEAMPSFLLTRCKKIYIMDTSHYLRAGKELSMGDLNDSAAFSYSGDMSIRIRIVDHNFVSNTYKHTVAHELSHIFDFSMGNPYMDPSGCSDTKEFLALYYSNPQSLSAYGATSQYEFFAEGGALYITTPQMLAVQNYDVYLYFDKLYGQYLK